MLPISICIICKNEESSIEKCLQRLALYSWEIVITDTGSTDNTLAIAQKYTSHIYHFEWCDDFSAARNFCISKASNDWILNVDCDEYLNGSLSEAALYSSLQPFLLTPSVLGTIEIQNPTSALTGGGVSTEQVSRFFHRNHYRYAGSVHEQPAPLHPETLQYARVPLSFYHVGYAVSEALERKSQRNILLLEKALQCDPNDPYLYYQLGQSYFAVGKMEKAYEAFDKGLSFDVNPDLQYVRTMVESYGYCMLNLKYYEQALSFEGIYDTFSSHADFVFLMGLIYMNNALLDAAVLEFEKAAHMSDFSVEGINSYLPNYNIGVIMECSGQTEKAAVYYRKCKQYAPALEGLKRMHSS